MTAIFASAKKALRSWTAALVCAGAVAATASVAVADESGVSFWLPGIFGSLAATPTTPTPPKSCHGPTL